MRAYTQARAFASLNLCTNLPLASSGSRSRGARQEGWRCQVQPQERDKHVLRIVSRDTFGAGPNLFQPRQVQGGSSDYIDERGPVPPSDWDPE